MTTFNGIALDDYVVVEKILIDIMPPITNGLAQGLQRSYYRHTIIEPRTVTIEVRLIEGDHKEVIEKAKELAGVLFSKENKPLILRTRPNEYIMAKIDGSTPLDQLMHTGFAVLTFLSDEGVFYSNTETTGSTGTNNGTLPAKPILSFTASGATQTISNGTRELHFNGLTTGDVVVIDTVTGIVTINGANGNLNELIVSRSDLFEIPTGGWEITGATATFRERSL